MKKLITLILILSLAVPAAALASNESDYVGKWIYTEYKTDGTLTFILIDIQPDHTAISVFGHADGDRSKVPGRSFIGSWQMTSTGIHVVSGYNTEKDLYIYENDYLKEKVPGLCYIYSKINEYGDDVNSSEQFDSTLLPEITGDGLRVPPGEYTVGLDIPAGVYRIEITDGIGYYDLYEKRDGKLISNGLTGDAYDVTEIGKLSLNDGNILLLVNSTFNFYPYTGLFN